MNDTITFSALLLLGEDEVSRRSEMGLLAVATEDMWLTVYGLYARPWSFQVIMPTMPTMTPKVEETWL